MGLPMTVPMATVLELWRWPVKGMGGERVPSVRVDARGTGGDRVHAVVRQEPDGTWIRLSERQQPRLAAWTAAYPFNLGANVDPAKPPLALVTAPSGRTFVWNDPRLRFALEDDLGHPVALCRDADGLQHTERTILVSWVPRARGRCGPTCTWRAATSSGSRTASSRSTAACAYASCARARGAASTPACSPAGASKPAPRCTEHRAFKVLVYSDDKDCADRPAPGG
jgi:hypothetical protein